MLASGQPLTYIFNGNSSLEVPFFQRAYVWREEQWERLLGDIEEACASDRLGNYFMGAVILKQQQTDMGQGYISTLIDGQQRLTTLSILFKVLSLMNGDLGSFDEFFRRSSDGGLLMRHNRFDKEAYEEVMALQSLESLEDKKTQSRIYEVYEYFRENLNTDKVTFDRICKLVFVVIELNYDEDEQQIFDTINSLGVRLTTAELLKNYFFDRNNEADYEEYWYKTFEKEEEVRDFYETEITTGGNRRTLFDIFLYAYLQIRIQDESLNVSPEDRAIFGKQEKLFESYKRFIDKYLGGDKAGVMREICDYAEIFRRAIDPNATDSEIPASASLERINAIMFGLDNMTLIPYVLFIEKNVMNGTAKNEVYGYLEAYIMRRIVTKATTKIYSKLFGGNLIAKRILTREALVEYLENQEDTGGKMPGDGEVSEAFHKTTLTNKQATGVLYLIESKIRNRENHATQLLGLEDYSLEHMMPKKWRNHWAMPEEGISSEDRDRTLLTMGNLTIIPQKLNTSIRDADWETKKKGKKDKGGLRKFSAGIDIVSEYLDDKKYPEWNESTIEERAGYLAGKALECWRS